MAAAFEDTERRLIPRWRDSRRTDGAELATEDAGRAFFELADFSRAMADWRRDRTLPLASELVGAAIVNGHTAEVREAAEQLLHEAPADSSLHMLACRALHGNASMAPQEETPEQASRRVAKLRSRLHADPRNAVALVDLAREYAVLAQLNKSEKAIERALILAPNNRFVLRAACALFVHAGDPERAIHVLRQSAATRSDSWLMAAEISASQVADRRSTNLKSGLKLLSARTNAPFQLAELAGALATEELCSGSTRAAKRLFTTALVDPNENTVAQVEWASGKQGVTGLPLEPRHFQLNLSYEARALEKRHAGKWLEALEEARGWLFDQPFSVAPALFGSYLAGTALDNQKEAERIARIGLRANPRDRMLTNNLVVALAINGKLGEAAKLLPLLDPHDEEPARRATFFATLGLVQYRLGAKDEGRALYARAIELLGAQDTRMKANAALYRAREELLLGGEHSHEYVAVAMSMAQRSKSPEIAAFSKVIGKVAASKGILVPPFQ